MKLHSQVASFTPANPKWSFTAYSLLLFIYSFITTIITRIEELDEVTAKRVSFRGNFGRDIHIFSMNIGEKRNVVLKKKKRRKRKNEKTPRERTLQKL